MWECQCECGAITYKATDTLTRPEESMCQSCQGLYAAENARKSAGFVDGTQISRIRNMNPTSSNIKALDIRFVEALKKMLQFRQGKKPNYF